MAGIVLVFDFDKTIIDCDSDEWIIAELGVEDVFRQLLPTMPWNSLMDRMMEEIHLRGNTIEDVAACLRRVPLDSHVVNAVKKAHALGCELRVVSDANRFFIETIFNRHGLLGCFAEINANPSYVDEHGRLRILPYHDSTSPPHGCTLCPSNMCKGEIVDRIRSTSLVEEKKRFIYLGDGKGDYCPSLRLSDDDHVMPKKKHPLWELINENAEMVKAEVHGWSNGEELEMTLLQLIHASLPPATITRLAPVDCKLEKDANGFSCTSSSSLIKRPDKYYLKL